MCTLRPALRHDSSMPGTSVIASGSALAAAPMPPTVSWSVRASTVMPAAAARRTTSAGGLVPSEAVE